MRKVILAVPHDSSFKIPLKEAFQKIGFEVILFDYRYMQGNLKDFLFETVLSIFKKLIKIAPSNVLINKQLVNLIKNQSPELLFVVKGESIDSETIKKIKLLNVTTINWMVDSVFNEKIWNWFIKVGPFYDVVLPCEEGGMEKVKKQKWKNKTIHMLAAADSGTSNKRQLVKKEYDLVFVGTNNIDRERYLYTLKDFDLNIWGYGFENTKLEKYYKGKMPYNNLLKTYAKSKIVLATTQSPYISVNNRVFEVGSVGGFVLIEYNKYLPSLFKIGEHLDCFKNASELKSKVEYYLQHDEKRELIASNLKKEVERKHTYDMRLKKILKLSKVI